jgi:hypothetical protein
MFRLSDIFPRLCLVLATYMEHDIGVVIAISVMMLCLSGYPAKAAVEMAGANETDLS